MENTHRSTSAHLLVLFGCLLLVVSLLALRLRQHREALEWIHYPTALGDTDYYQKLGSTDQEDYFKPNLSFIEKPEGIYRRNQKGQHHEDLRMLKISRDSSNRINVYTLARRKDDAWVAAPPEQRRYFVKSEENTYLEFGEQKYFPPENSTP